MKHAALSAVLLVLASGWSLAQVATSNGGSDLGNLQSVVQGYVDELRTALPDLQKQLHTEDAAARQFDQYVQRMHRDAAMQRTVLALGNVRPPALAQAQRNWNGWQEVARNRLAEATDAQRTAKQARQDEQERWTLLGNESNANLAASLGAIYKTAQALHARKLALLTRLEDTAGRSAKQAQAAIQLCQDTDAAIARTADRLRSRFLWTRARIADLPNKLDEARTDLGLIFAPFAEVSVTAWRQQLGTLLRGNWVAVFTALALLAVLLWRGRDVRRRLRVVLGRLRWGRGLPRRFAHAVGTALSRCVLSGAVAAIALALRIWLGAGAPAWSESFLSLAIAVFLWRFAYTLVGALFDPNRPDRRITQMDDDAAAWLRRRLQHLANWLLIATVDAALVRRVGLTATPVMLGFVVVELFTLRSLHAVLRSDRLAGAGLPSALAPWVHRWRMAVRTAAVVMIGLCGFGFLNLAWYAGWGMLKTTVLLGGGALLGRLGRELIEESGAAVPAEGRHALRRAWSAMVAVGILIAVPYVWNVHVLLLHGLSEVLGFGFEAGTHRITVLRVVIAAACLGAAWSAGRLTGSLLERRVFPRMLFDVGVRTAISTSLNYIIITAGVLIAIRAMGFDLTNLAIMAGALGVGIGFGLQSLVANFVSGLVILFERPFKIGDILEHDGVYGYVRHIRKRSTVLRTLDESELVLPNSELLSHKITNWTLSDNRARLTVEVGVAYGSEVVKVRDTLLRVASEHPRVAPEPAPQVYFVAFGDSSLEFRLMVWADVRERLRVLSDLHFAVDAAFREVGIQIPFPQRDVHFFPTQGKGKPGS